MTVADRKSSDFEGGGQGFRDVRFHRADELEQWRRGAPLNLALRCLAPLTLDEYRTRWAPDKAPRDAVGGFDKDWGKAERQALWDKMLQEINDGSCELRTLPLGANPSARMVVASRDWLNVVGPDAVLDIDKSMIVVPGGERLFARVFLAGGGAETAAQLDPAIDAETFCRAWLEDLMNAGAKEKPKHEYWIEAKAKFKRLSKRGFGRAWDQALKINPAWGDAGRPKTFTP